MRYETGNPVGPDGSSSPFDLHDNAGVIDLLVNGPLGEYLSRLGIPLKSWRGIMQQVTDYLIAQGYESVYLVYGAGVIVERQTQLVQRSGELYRAMNAADIPLTLTGTWATDAPKLQAVGDAALRQLLAGPTGTTFIGRGDETLEESLAGMEGDIEAIRPALKTGLPSALGQMQSQIGNLVRFSLAAASGTIRIAMVGDSILQSINQIDYRDGPAGLLMRVLEEQNPGISFVFGNFSIPGQGLYQFRSPTYVGGAANVPDATFAMAESSNAERRWPGGTTTGKTWYNHVRDFAPDILVFGFGMNHVNSGSGMYSPTTISNATFWRDVDSMISSWAAKPSVALIPSMLPTHDSVIDGGIWPRFRVQVQQDADMQRAMCREKNWTCVDVNRLWSIATDAKDPVLMRHNHFLGLANYADKFDVTAGSWSVTGGDSLQGYGALRSKDMCTDLYQKIRYTVSDISASTPGMFWRDRGDVVGGQQNAYFLLVVRSAGNDLLNFYWQGQTIKSQLIGAAKNTYDIEVLCEGGRHRIWVDKVLMADESHMGNMGQGYHGVSIYGTTASTLSISEFRQGTPSVVGLPQYTDVDMLGLGQDEWASNPDSLGGGKINHPSKLGVAVAYLPAFEPLVSAMRSIIARSAGPVCINGKDETVDFWTDLNYATLVVDDIVQQRVYPVVTGDYVSLNSTICQALNLESTKVVIVYIWHNENAQHLPTSVTLAPGRWVIQASMGLSKSSSTRHVETLNLVAHKV